MGHLNQKIIKTKDHLELFHAPYSLSAHDFYPQADFQDSNRFMLAYKNPLHYHVISWTFTDLLIKN